MQAKRELPLIIIVLLPFFYLIYIWEQLPDKVPMHWNIRGEIDRYGDKTELILLTVLLSLVTYIFFLVILKIDPKNKLRKMGHKFHVIKFLMTTFMSVLSLVIIISIKNASLDNTNYYLLVGALYIVLGNYFKTIRPNYFIGIRTPWTLESENVWKKTHKLGGLMLFAGGIVVVLSSLFLERQMTVLILMIVTGIISIVPIIQSYVLYQNEKSLSH